VLVFSVDVELGGLFAEFCKAVPAVSRETSARSMS
jgi:hypothetical protein